MPKSPVVSTPTGVLPDTYKAAALLEAQGFSRREIAQQCGISEPTVARLRRTPEYQAEVARMGDLAVKAIAPLMDRLNTQVIQALGKAITTLEGQLDAENDEGAPLYGIRTESAKLLAELGVKHLGNLAAAARGAGDGGGGGAPSAAKITVNINHDGHATAAIDVPEADVQED